MGKEIELLAGRLGHNVRSVIDPVADGAKSKEITPDALSGVDVAIEFTQPDAAVSNIEKTAKLGVNMVVGTTGWSDKRGAVKQIVEESGIGLIYGANFSLGMNLFFEIVSHSARLVGMLPQYDAYISEEHHSAKKDAPSGTALNLLDMMRPHLNNPNLNIASIRAGSTPGTHVIGFDSVADTIILEHRARSRQGFAEGAILAARWIVEKKGLYDFRKVFREIVGIS